MKVALLCFSAMALSQSPAVGTLKVTIAQARSNKGKVACAVYNSKEGFPSDPTKAIKSSASEIHGDKAECSFSEVPKGTLAVSCYHDENGNGKLDTGLFGIPKEGVATSNNAKGRMGPPSFEDASFAFDGTEKQLLINLRYL